MSATICPTCLGFTNAYEFAHLHVCLTCHGTGRLEATPTPEDLFSPEDWAKIKAHMPAPQAQPASGDMALANKAIYGDREGAYTADMKKIKRVATLLAQARTEARRDEAKWWQAKLTQYHQYDKGGKNPYAAEINNRYAELGGSDE